MNRKLIFFTQRVEEVPSYKERRDCADQRISEFLLSAGCCPIPVPNARDAANLLLDIISPDGIVLTGGNSLVKYGGTAPERDEADRILIEYAVKMGTPLYGFCRGMQSILDYFGNTLVQIPGHVAVRHRVYGSGVEATVNSFHGQGCIELSGNTLAAEMRSDDGVIEMVRHKELPVVGTMWHPERNTPFEKMDINLVKELFGLGGIE